MRRFVEEAVMFGLCVFAVAVSAVGYVFPPWRRQLVAAMAYHLEHLED